MDADLSHPPEEIASLLQPVSGERGRSRHRQPLHSWWGNAGLAGLAPISLARRIRARLSTYRRSRFHGRIFCDPARVFVAIR